MHDRVRLAAVMVVALIALHPGRRSTSAQAPPARDPFVGTFANEQLSVTLRATGDGYEGQATYQGQTFRVQARVTGGRMSGVYSTRGQTMPFEAAVQGARSVPRRPRARPRASGRSSSRMAPLCRAPTPSRIRRAGTGASRDSLAEASAGAGASKNGALLLTEDGVSWSAHPLRIPQNSNGYPIITADGKEYSQCR